MGDSIGEEGKFKMKSFSGKESFFFFLTVLFYFSSSQELRRCSESNCSHQSAGHHSSECCGPGRQCALQYTESSHGQF